MTDTGPRFGISSQLSLFGHPQPVSFGFPDWRVEIIDVHVAREIIKKNHYSHTFINNSTDHHGLFVDGELMGVLDWGPGLNPASGGGVVAGTESHQWRELSRMWMDDRLGRNTESRAISYSIKLLRKSWPHLGWLQSFADERCGCLGVVYQASNFWFLGSYESTFYELDGEVFHKIAATVRGEELAKRANAQRLQARINEARQFKLKQFRYFLPLKKWAIKNLLLKREPYPKHGTGAESAAA